MSRSISDISTPIVILYGPYNVGKTLSIVCLLRYLRNSGYNFITDISYDTATESQRYRELCDIFGDFVHHHDNIPLIKNGMLHKVIDTVGRPICQIIDEQGGIYFNHSLHIDTHPIVKYINSCPNRKIWIIYLEPDWESDIIRSKYIEQIALLKSQASRNDRFIIVLNKIDYTNFMISYDKVNMSAVKRMIDLQYNGLLRLFSEPNPLLSIIRPYRCEILPYFSGYFTKSINGREIWNIGPDSYPGQLWHTIRKSI